VTTVKRRAKAKTAYELLGRVCEAIKAHRFAYYQGAWSMKAEWAFPPEQAARNECGTAFCRAGWMVALHDGAKNIDVAADKVLLPGSIDYVSIPTRASELLDMSADDQDVLALFDGEACSGVPGSSGYVAQGIRGLRAFMKKHAKHLKARSLKGV
jgi:hypothetical protein